MFKMAHLSLFTLVLLQCCIHQAASDIHCITAKSTKLGSTRCVTLHQFATDIIHDIHPNSTLVLLPGRHYLTLNLSLSNVDNFSMTSENTTAQIVCTDYSHIFFNSSQDIHITNLEFIGCGGNLVKNVQEFVVRDTKFKGEDNSETALELVETTAEIINSTFISNRGKICISHSYKEELSLGGAIIAHQSNAYINQCIFINNTATDRGGALYSKSSNVTIEAGKFENNTAEWGGVLVSVNSNITIKVSEFDHNIAEWGGVLVSDNTNINIEASEFDHNTADWGGVLVSVNSNITIYASEVDNNTATCDGGVLFSWNSNIIIEESEFDHNTAESGGALVSVSSNITIKVSEFDHNIAEWGGVLVSDNSNINIETSEFDNTIAHWGGVLDSWDSNINIKASEFDHNTADWGGVLISDGSNIIIHASEFDNNTASHDGGVLDSWNSNITIEESEFENNAANHGGGVLMTQLQSNVFFDGICSLKHNQANNGGAIFSIGSKLYVNGNVSIAHNTATRNGGGVYLLNSDLNCQEKSQFVLINNTAKHKGGGLHAISSYIKVFSRFNLRTNLTLEKNTAERGGALSMAFNAKLYILKYRDDSAEAYYYDSSTNTAAVFTANNADYGGAVYVDDDTSFGTCASDPKVESTECFFQVLAIRIVFSESLRTHTIHFSNNKAYISGSTLYGGLLDRCAVSQFAEVHNKHELEEEYEYTGNGVDYFYDVSTIANNSVIEDFSILSSRAVQACLCIDNEHNCTYQTSHIEVKKGQKFTVSLVAVDQIGHPLSSTIQASLNFTESGIAEGQLARKIPGECTNLTFNVVSPHNTEALTLYASDGPCKDAGISKKTVITHFLPCSCPVGLQPLDKSEINCTCDCHDAISQYVEDCDSHTGSFVRKPQARVWISYINHTSVTGYLIYSNCPFDYCNSSNLSVNLNQPDGADAQCAFNRSSLLCGSCHPDQSLSLGSSHCISCPSYWPALFLIITITATLAGIALVTLLLLLNISVAVGTLNGLIFYVNVVYTNKSILLPIPESNFLLVFMSWLNLELGIDTCYFPGMDTYAKIWLQLAFPVYMILLVILVIAISSYSVRFSNLIGKKNPVATLATLILLSYAKLLEICFKSLSVGILEYPDGSCEKLWLPDATVKYLSGKHIPLFIVAVLILLVGLVYTALLFLWQWLLLLPRWRIFKWSRDPKLQTFIQTYHAPYVSKHRYWTGLLLLARVILYLVAALNTSNDPQVALVAIIFTVISIIVLIGTLGRVYSKWPLGVLEILFHWNILFFAVFTWYTIDKVDRSHQEAVAYTSVIITLLILLFIILYHVYTYTVIFSKIKTMEPGRIINRLLTESAPNPKPEDQISPPDDEIHRFNELLDMIDQPLNTNDYEVPLRQKPAEPTHSVVEVHKPYHAPPDPQDADSLCCKGSSTEIGRRKSNSKP